MTDRLPQPDNRRRGVIRLQRPRCVRCGERLKVYGGKWQKDGSWLQYAKCRSCGAKHKVYWE